ncbi:TPA: hypothetical protein HA235_05570 [Candidatus Woesearchaeota archaeon]|nr:hypothetical protein [Candidatus Woesearchaeota archaeon]HIH32150.1 hypothetical protein [Candidatus Woesearchaeota archaeon]HIH55043.1 hypothetical protein [Candidatus Woesearchaeota archaeon]HIJ02465.1 hypothetical protein [Candidatus Woesearchaeota archaeon]HIJ14655.1 hypothetical protein [Candidatus Woesearchaeota archaeon]
MNENELIKYDNEIIYDQDNKLVIANKSELSLSEVVQRPEKRIDKMILENRLLIGDSLMIGEIRNITFDFKNDWMMVDCSIECYSEKESNNLTSRLLNKFFKKNFKHDQKKFHFNWAVKDNYLPIYSYSLIDERICGAIKSVALKQHNLLLSDRMLSEVYFPLVYPLRAAYNLFRKT